jgi:hypothetical protein
MWGKRNLLHCWWEWKSMEINAEVPQKTKNETTIQSSDTTPRPISKGIYSRM